MKQKTFVKQMMALGLSRNKANEFVRQELKQMTKCRKIGLPVWFAWEEILSTVLKELDDIFCHGQNIVWLGGTGAKYCKWMMKRSKEQPGRSWDRNHPGMKEEQEWMP